MRITVNDVELRRKLEIEIDPSNSVQDLISRVVKEWDNVSGDIRLMDAETHLELNPELLIKNNNIRDCTKIDVTYHDTKSVTETTLEETFRPGSPSITNDMFVGFDKMGRKVMHLLQPSIPESSKMQSAQSIVRYNEDETIEVMELYRLDRNLRIYQLARKHGIDFRVNIWGNRKARNRVEKSVRLRVYHNCRCQATFGLRGHSISCEHIRYKKCSRLLKNEIRVEKRITITDPEFLYGRGNIKKSDRRNKLLEGKKRRFRTKLSVANEPVPDDSTSFMTQISVAHSPSLGKEPHQQINDETGNLKGKDIKAGKIVNRMISQDPIAVGTSTQDLRTTQNKRFAHIDQSERDLNLLDEEGLSSLLEAYQTISRSRGSRQTQSAVSEQPDTDQNFPKFASSVDSIRSSASTSSKIALQASAEAASGAEVEGHFPARVQQRIAALQEELGRRQAIQIEQTIRERRYLRNYPRINGREEEMGLIQRAQELEKLYQKSNRELKEMTEVRKVGPESKIPLHSRLEELETFWGMYQEEYGMLWREREDFAAGPAQTKGQNVAEDRDDLQTSIRTRTQDIKGKAYLQSHLAQPSHASYPPEIDRRRLSTALHLVGRPGSSEYEESLIIPPPSGQDKSRVRKTYDSSPTANPDRNEAGKKHSPPPAGGPDTGAPDAGERDDIPPPTNPDALWPTILGSGGWEKVRRELPDYLRSDVEYEGSCWTYIPGGEVAPESIPLTIGGAPVIVPVRCRYPTLGAVAPPPDPHPRRINPRQPLDVKTIKLLFKAFPEAMGFYLLLNGLLQVIAPDGVDHEWVSSYRPKEFGQLRVCYVNHSMSAGGDRFSATRQSTTYSNLDGSLRAPRDSFSFRNTRDLWTIPRSTTFELEHPVEARSKGSMVKRKHIGRVGVKTRYNGKVYLTTSSQLIANALRARKSGSFLRKWFSGSKLSTDWASTVEILAHGKKIGYVAKDFDSHAKDHPVESKYDTALVEPYNESDLRDATSPIPNLGWLSHKGWKGLIRGTITSLKILSDESPNAKNLASFLPSECLVVGQGIYLDQSQLSGSEQKILLSHDSTDTDLQSDLNRWASLISHSLLYRVSPEFPVPAAQGGLALYAHGDREDGTFGAGVAGFQSFLQRSGYMCGTSAGVGAAHHPNLHPRARKELVAFYGAFEVPELIRKKHVIL